jgi:hypothetical protein
MALSLDEFNQLPSAPENVIDMIDSLNALKAVHPEQRRSPEVKHAIAELECLIRNAGVKLLRVRDDSVRKG